ncbi:MAG: glycosyl transferase family 51, partial [Desulfobulbaceae bacterium]|nr:glycosyl transferase family 51 [Desulfobulbaceae bacterium]
PDLLFDGHTSEYEFLRELHYGLGFTDYLAKVESDAVESGELSRKEREELDLRKELLARNYLRFISLRDELLAVQERIAGKVPLTPVPGDDITPPEGMLLRNQQGDQFRYGVAPASGGWLPVADDWLRNKFVGMDDAMQQKFWQAVSIEGKVSVATLDQLRAISDEEYISLAALPPYGAEVLHQVRDFRVLVALRYLIDLCRELGIESRLDPVLSFPLGSNVISLLEVARVYEAISSGSTFRNENGDIGEAISIIDRVENSDGEVVFAPKRLRRPAVAPPVSLAVCDIMRNVVRFGTGQYADRNLFLRSRDPAKAAQLAELRLVWPVIGKTGTANRYTNAAFAGVVPGSEGERNTASLDGGYVVTAYVGFDDNTPMTRTTTHLTGSSGALPLWTELAKSIILDHDYAGNMDVVDFYFAAKPKIPLRYENLGQIAVPVDAANGGIVTVGKAETPATVVTFGTQTADGMTPTRFFLPFWRAGESGL